MGCCWLLMPVALCACALAAAVDTMTGCTDRMPLPSGSLQHTPAWQPKERHWVCAQSATIRDCEAFSDDDTYDTYVA